MYDSFPADKLSKPPVSLHGQLIWREYNYLMGYTTPNFDRMQGNPVARQIPWDDDPELLAAWKESRTGFPFIDAIMTQLKETGWIHHLARHAVACFLTRGDLWQSWEEGAAVFEEQLIDADWSINNFNWQVSPSHVDAHMFCFRRTQTNLLLNFLVALLHSPFLSVLSMLQSRRLWKEDRSKRRLHSQVATTV